jgi:predicted ABC-type ATPase
MVAGPNGAGKSTLYRTVIGEATGIRFVNADDIAAATWPDSPAEHAYDAARVASQERLRLLSQRQSFATETVFSHPSKLDLLVSARQAGYRIYLHIVLIPEELAVARVAMRRENGGHDVPEEKIRARFARLWNLVREAIELVDEAWVYDNTERDSPFRVVASYRRGRSIEEPAWPTWTPTALTG